jgi:hypothetical protein
MADKDCKSELDLEDRMWDAYLDGISNLEFAEMFLDLYEALFAECRELQQETDPSDENWPHCIDERRERMVAEQELQDALDAYHLGLDNYVEAAANRRDCESGHKGFRNWNRWGGS